MTLPGMKRRKRKVKYDIDSISRPLMEASVKNMDLPGALSTSMRVAQAKAAIQVHEMFPARCHTAGPTWQNGFMGEDATLWERDPGG